MNRYFDLLLVHADPVFQRLEETFYRLNDIKTKIRYTGYVAQSSQSNPVILDDDGLPLDETDEPLILASIGGGRVGYELLACAVEASEITGKTLPYRMLIFTGPYLPDEQFLQLQEMIKRRPNIILRRYTAHFLSYMEKADLSISMAGYNTCMNILATGVRALVLPFTGGENNEQTIRADKLEALRIVTVIRPHELQPDRLAEKIVQCLKKEQVTSTLDLHGVEKTAVFLTDLLKKQDSTGQSTVGLSPNVCHKMVGFNVLETELRPYLEQFQEGEKEINIFLRDDDVDEDEETLRHLLDISLSFSVPLNLEIIPGRLTASAKKLLKEHNRFHSTLLELHQHGWQHCNHEREGKKCEFGISRSFHQQREDIAKGKALLEKTFGDRFYPVFTPPWNRCTEETFKVLDELGFKVLSKDQNKQLVTGYSFKEISTTLDLYRWKGNRTMKSPDEITKALISQIERLKTLGILLHHKVMDEHAFAFLQSLLNLSLSLLA